MSESVAGPSGPGTVVLELGAGVGALVLYTPAEHGRPGDRDQPGDDPGARRTHSQVRPRHMPAGTRYAAVYPDLATGQYTIWADEEHPAGRSSSPAAGSPTGAGQPEPLPRLA